MSRAVAPHRAYCFAACMFAQSVAWGQAPAGTPSSPLTCPPTGEASNAAYPLIGIVTGDIQYICYGDSSRARRHQRRHDGLMGISAGTYLGLKIPEDTVPKK
jgi:hypothetical protein